MAAVTITMSSRTRERVGGGLLLLCYPTATTTTYGDDGGGGRIGIGADDG